jgi:hypothetical protein
LSLRNCVGAAAFSLAVVSTACGDQATSHPSRTTLTTTPSTKLTAPAPTTASPATPPPDRTAPSTESSPPAASDTTTAVVYECRKPPSGSSPAVFDASRGTYAAFITAFNPESATATFDVVQWLSGSDARTAWARDHPDDPLGPIPNDYYLVNASSQRRNARIRTNATVLLIHNSTDYTAALEPDRLANLPSYLARGSPEDVYWLTFDSGEITYVCEQYRP